MADEVDGHEILGIAAEKRLQRRDLTGRPDEQHVGSRSQIALDETEYPRRIALNVFGAAQRVQPSRRRDPDVRRSFPALPARSVHDAVR